MQKYLETLWNSTGNHNHLGSVYNTIKSNAVVNDAMYKRGEEKIVDIEAVFDFVGDLSVKFGYEKTSKKVFGDSSWGFLNEFREFFPNNNENTIIEYFQAFYKEDPQNAMDLFKTILPFSPENRVAFINPQAVAQSEKFFLNLVKGFKSWGCEDLSCLHDASEFVFNLLSKENLIPEIKNANEFWNENFKATIDKQDMRNVLELSFSEDECRSVYNFAKNHSDEIVENFLKNGEITSESLKESILLVSISKNEKLVNRLVKFFDSNYEELQTLNKSVVETFTTTKKRMTIDMLQNSKLASLVLNEAVNRLDFNAVIANSASSRYEPMSFENFESLLRAEVKVSIDNLYSEKLYSHQINAFAKGLSKSFDIECGALLREEFRDKIPDFLEKALDSSLIKMFLDKKIPDFDDSVNSLKVNKLKSFFDNKPSDYFDSFFKDCDCSYDFFKNLIVLYTVAKENVSSNVHEKIEKLKDVMLERIVSMPRVEEKDMGAFIQALTPNNIKALHDKILEKGELPELFSSNGFEKAFKSFNELKVKGKDVASEPIPTEKSSVYTPIIALFPNAEDWDVRIDTNRLIKVGFNLDKKFNLRENLLLLVMSNSEVKKMITDFPIKIEKTGLVKSTILGHSDNLVNLIQSDPDRFIPMLKEKEMMKIITTVPEEINIKIMYEVLNGALKNTPVKSVEPVDIRTIKL